MGYKDKQDYIDYHKKYRQRPEVIARKKSKNGAEARYRQKHRSEINQRQREAQKKRRLKILTHYSNGLPECKCCGVTTIEFLSLDHINGKGNKHRKSMGGGTAFYCWIIKTKFPKGYQVLCHNCNLAKGYYGKCPHLS